MKIATSASISILFISLANTINCTTITSAPPITLTTTTSNTNFTSSTAIPGASPTTTTIYHSTPIHHGLPTGLITGGLPEASAFLNQQKYWISTYYSCNTRWETVHCGTHEQVLKGTGPNGESLPEGGQPLQTSTSAAAPGFSSRLSLMEGDRTLLLLLMSVLVGVVGGGGIW